MKIKVNRLFIVIPIHSVQEGSSVILQWLVGIISHFFSGKLDFPSIKNLSFIVKTKLFLKNFLSEFDWYCLDASSAWLGYNWKDQS